MITPKRYLVRFGRCDQSAIKTIFEWGKKSSFHIANSIAYVLWKEHVFKVGGETYQRTERDGFWIEIFPEVIANDDAANDSQGEHYATHCA